MRSLLHHMARMKRVVAVGLPHHITQRGNNRRDVFLTDSFKRVYLELLREHAFRNHLKIIAYCLMSNHIHLVAIPEDDQSMAQTLRHTHGRFAQYWNTQLSGSGHMWQNRYYSCPLEPPRVWAVARYVEMNPVRAGIVGEAGDYGWSSAAAHIIGMDPSGVLDLAWWRKRWNEGNWAQALMETSGGADDIRRATFAGRPLGSGAFIQGLEMTLGRPLAARSGGRPRKPGTVSSVPGFG